MADEKVKRCPYCRTIINGSTKKCPKCWALIPKDKDNEKEK